MGTEIIDAIRAELLEQHPVALSDGDEHRWDAFERALKLLPNIDRWAIAETGPAVFAISRDTLFTVRVTKKGRVSVESRPQVGHKLIVCMASKPVRTTEAQTVVREAKWTFRYIAEDQDASGVAWRNITGKVYGERPDRREDFARALASLAGWGAAEA